jgi:hypothetical protein
VPNLRLDRLNTLPFAPVVGAMFGVVAMILVIATPSWLFSRAVVATHLPSIIAVASPPLGDKARVIAALLLGLLIAAILWLLIDRIEKWLAARALVANADDDELGETAPQASRRRPIFAQADLGAPFMSDEAMAVARDELVLDNVMPDQPSEPLAADPPIPPQAALQQEADEPAQQFGAGEPIAALMARLEDALERREQRFAPPPRPGDLASLRQALGLELGHG